MSWWETRKALELTVVSEIFEKKRTQGRNRAKRKEKTM